MTTVMNGGTSPSRTTSTPASNLSKSLRGFDPLLPDFNRSKTIGTSSELDKKWTSILAVTSDSSGAITPPIDESEAEEREEEVELPRITVEDVSSELRKIASHLQESSKTNKIAPVSPTPLRASASASKLKKGSSRKGRSLTGDTSPLKKGKSILGLKSTVSKSDLINNTDESADFVPLTPLQKATSTSNFNKTFPTAATPPPLTPHVSAPVVVSPPVIPELMDLKTTPASMDIPSLAKQRPTSFLTGQEVVKSSEHDATEWQLGIPTKNDFLVSTKLALFLDTYRKEECLLDLSSLVGCTRMELTAFAVGNHSPATAKISSCHRPLVESLLECGDWWTVSGYVRSSQSDACQNNRREILVLERERQFLCVCRGSNAEQAGKFSKQPRSIRLKDNGNVSVFEDRFNAFNELEPELFALLDKLAEENPFFDVVFAGQSFGGAMAAIASYRYACARPELRVAAWVSACPKLGLQNFRLSAHSTANLSVTRLEYGRTQQQPNYGYHVGHTIRIHPSVTSSKASASSASIVTAYRFGVGEQEPASRTLLFKREKDTADFVAALEALDKFKHSWAENFFRQDGAGVRGKDNEARQMV